MKALAFDFNGTMYMDTDKHRQAWDIFFQKYIGRPLAFRPPPRALIIYLAFYLHFGEPFFKVIARDPVLLF